MKLAEALSLRKDLQKKIEQLKVRLVSNVKVQEGDEPAENPDELMKELDGCLKQLEQLIGRINATNMATIAPDGRTLTAMMAQKEVLSKRIEVLRAVFDKASSTQDRYSRTEIKYVTTVPIKPLNKQINDYSRTLRELDLSIQALNFSVDLIE